MFAMIPFAINLRMMSIGLTLRCAARSRTVRLLGSSIGFGGGGGATGAGGGGGAGLTAVGAGVATGFVTTGRAVGIAFGAAGRVGSTGLTGIDGGLVGAGAVVVIVARALETGATCTEVGLAAYLGSGAVAVKQIGATA